VVPSVLQPYVGRPGLEGRRWWPLPPRGVALRLAVVGAVLLALGVALAVAVARDEAGMDARDLAVNQWFRDLGTSNGFVLQLAEWVSWIGSGRRTGPIVTVFAVVLLVLRQWRWAVFQLVVTQVGYLISDVTKVAVGRQRPPWTDFGPLESGTSFPSGHTFGGVAAWVAMGLVLLFLLPRAWSTVLAVSCWCVGLANGPSRLVVAEHWVTDVLGGLLLGAGWLLVVFAACLWVWGPGRGSGGDGDSDPGPKADEAGQAVAQAAGGAAGVSGAGDGNRTRMISLEG
jgi:membrane-associated phospholipid phosphatase